MDQEEKIKELEQRLKDIEHIISRNAFSFKRLCSDLEPMFLEWCDEKQHKDQESTAVLYG